MTATQSRAAIPVSFDDADPSSERLNETLRPSSGIQAIMRITIEVQNGIEQRAGALFASSAAQLERKENRR